MTNLINKAAMEAFEVRAEAAYAAMYDAAPHNVKDYYDDTCLYFAEAIQIADALGLSVEAARLRARTNHIEAVYNHQFRYVGR
jgi:hypothetical protein